MKIIYDGITIDSNEFIAQDWMSLNRLAMERNGTGYSQRTIPTSDMIAMLRKFFNENGRMPRNEDFHGEILKFSAACFHTRFGGSKLILDALCRSVLCRRAREEKTTSKEDKELLNFEKVRNSLDNEKLQRFIDEVEAFYVEHGVLPTCIDLANCQFSISRGNFYNKFRSFELLEKALKEETTFNEAKTELKEELLTIFDDIVKRLDGTIPENASDAKRIANSFGMSLSVTDILFTCGSYGAFVKEYQKEFRSNIVNVEPPISEKKEISNVKVSSDADASELMDIRNVESSIVCSASLYKILTSLIVSSRETQMDLAELISALIIGVKKSGADASKLIELFSN